VTCEGEGLTLVSKFVLEINPQSTKSQNLKSTNTRVEVNTSGSIINKSIQFKKNNTPLPN